MIDKISPSLEAAVADIHDGATILIGGFGTAGMPATRLAARCTIAQVTSVAELGELDPEAIVTPGIFVQRIVQGEPACNA